MIMWDARTLTVIAIHVVSGWEAGRVILSSVTCQKVCPISPISRFKCLSVERSDNAADTESIQGRKDV